MLSRERDEETLGLSEQVLEREFSVQPDSDLIRLIDGDRRREQTDIVQEKLNELFDSHRRDRMLARASKSVAGIPAVYFRYIPRDQFLLMLKKGVHSPEDYINKTKVDEQTLTAYIHSYFEELSQGKADQDAVSVFRDQDLETKVRQLFPDVPHAMIQDLIARRDYRQWQKFLDDHVSNDQKRLAHKVGWPGIELSNMLSASAGGPVVASGGMNREDVVYIEFVSPDNRISTHGRDLQTFLRENMGGDKEKEVFLKEIPLSWVTRVFVDRRQLVREAIEEPNTPIQQFARTHPVPKEDDIDAYEHWRKHADTKDMVPIAVARRFRKRSENDLLT